VDLAIVGYKGAKRRHKHVLKCVLGVLLRSQDLPAEAEEATVITSCEDLERVMAPLAQQSDELLI
jgi:hypothetical protein